MKEALFGSKEQGHPDIVEALLQINILKELFSAFQLGIKQGEEGLLKVKLVQAAVLKLKNQLASLAFLNSEDRKMIEEAIVEIQECCISVEIEKLKLAKLIGTLETLRDLFRHKEYDKSGFRVKALLTLNILRNLVLTAEDFQKKEQREAFFKQLQELAAFLEFYLAKLNPDSDKLKKLEELKESLRSLKGHLGAEDSLFLAGLIETLHDLL
jgi:hypothetical protein